MSDHCNLMVLHHIIGITWDSCTAAPQKDRNMFPGCYGFYICTPYFQVSHFSILLDSI